MFQSWDSDFSPSFIQQWLFSFIKTKNQKLFPAKDYQSTYFLWGPSYILGRQSLSQKSSALESDYFGLNAGSAMTICVILGNFLHLEAYKMEFKVELEG